VYLVTALDLQERLIRMMGGQADDESVNDIRTSIRQALRIVSAEHNWPYYHDYLHITTNETYTTGTIAYTASTRAVVLTSGTWPVWAEQGVLIIDSKHVRVQTRTNGTNLVVRADDAPVDDYTGTYTLYQYQFTLDTDYNIYKVGKVQVDQSNWIEYVPPSIFETDIKRQWLTTGGRPRWFTISRDIANVGQNLLSLWPYPTTELRCRLGYVRHPKDIRNWSESSGTVTTALSTAVSGSETLFTQRHVGSVIRTYSDRINLPTSADGRYPPVDESVVKTVTDSTNLVTASALTTAAADVSYVISDILDVDNTIMYEVIAYAARLELARLRSMEPKLVQVHIDNYERMLYLAKAQTANADSIRVAGSFRSGNLGWPGLWDSYYVLT